MAGARHVMCESAFKHRIGSHVVPKVRSGRFAFCPFYHVLEHGSFIAQKSRLRRDTAFRRDIAWQLSCSVINHHKRHNPNTTYLYTVVKKSLCTWRLQYKKLMIWSRPSQNTFGMWTMLYWTQFKVSINVWRLAADNLNITCNSLYCNHQVHGDFLITLYKYIYLITLCIYII